MYFKLVQREWTTYERNVQGTDDCLQDGDCTEQLTRTFEVLVFFKMSIQDTNKPVKDTPFPSVTICTEGINMDAIIEVTEHLILNTEKPPYYYYPRLWLKTSTFGWRQWRKCQLVTMATPLIFTSIKINENNILSDKSITIHLGRMSSCFCRILLVSVRVMT